jgi:aspartyl-tRNA(Asn)/glutamyl-tRNA(Gln) amidotransferase subunit C
MAQELTQEQVSHVAHLARLSLTDEQLARYTEQLSEILDYVAQLQSTDVAGIEPIGQVTGLVNILQQDKPAADTVDRELFLAGAPAAEAPYVKVKAVLE